MDSTSGWRRLNTNFLIINLLVFLIMFFPALLLSEVLNSCQLSETVAVYEYPEEDAGIIATLQKGTVVEVREHLAEWKMIQFQGGVGFIKSDEIEKVLKEDTVNSVALGSSKNSINVQGCENQISEGAIQISANTLRFSPQFQTEKKSGQSLLLKFPANVYESKSSASRILLPLKSGASVILVSEEGAWQRIQIDNVEGFILKQSSDLNKQAQRKQKKNEVEDKLFIMGLAMLRLNWTDIEGDTVRFRYSDLGLPADFSTRERASFTIDGTMDSGEIEIDGYLNYDPDNRITEPPLEFLLNVKRGMLHLSVGDYRNGVLRESIFAHYRHPFRGATIGIDTEPFTLEFIGGMARGESTIEEVPATLGSGPYYLTDAPVLRGSETVFLVTKSRTDGTTELQRRMLLRNQDYYMDYDRGTVILTYSQLPTDELGNPVSLVVAYQFESLVGRFSRAIYGFNSNWRPFSSLQLSTSFIADADKSLPLSEMFEERKGILSVGFNYDTERIALLGEMAWGMDPVVEDQAAHFIGGRANLFSGLRLLMNSWSIDSEFPAFANRQIQYGYSLMQVMPELNQRSVMLSPFQFTRNLGSELYPFTLSRLALGDKETHGILEWENGDDLVSVGYGVAESDDQFAERDTTYASYLHNGEQTIAWAKAGNVDQESLISGNDTQLKDVLGGVRHRLKQFSNGDLFVQFDAQADWLSEPGYDEDTHSNAISLFTEYISGQDGIYLGFRRQELQPASGADVTVNAFETGIRHPLYRGLFVDSRYRYEETEDDSGTRGMSFLALGLGFENERFRALGRYETQISDLDPGENRRETWSLFLFGSPLPRMSISFQYYNRQGENDTFVSLTRRSEEQLNLRFIWRPWPSLNLYSQWRYDTNLELLPPLDEIESQSLATVQGIKWQMAKRFELLANYKLLKIWGPINNKKYSAAVELGYLFWEHMRLGLGVEVVDYEDDEDPVANYTSNIFYMKFVLFY